MSRSFKKPYYTDQQGSSISKYNKRRANKALRNQPLKDFASGKQYRKEFDSWNIRDWSFYSKDQKAKRK